MTPFEFLKQEFDNIQEALNDSLRHDYGPEGSADYYEECSHRLTELKRGLDRVDPKNDVLIAEKLAELDVLGLWISLIERSHLGEFSWPFANTLRKAATELLTEVRVRAPPSKPIVHIIGAGEGYHINTEGPISAATKGRRFVIVGFPRSLKNHVLLHALFGHELGHAVVLTGAPLVGMLNAFVSKGHLKNPLEMTNWLHMSRAPQEVRQILKQYKRNFAHQVIVDEDCWRQWVYELACDLFGLLFFGPSFAAAACTFLKFREKHPYLRPIDEEDGLTHHPPYACRHKLLTQALRVLGWNRAVSDRSNGDVHAAERAMLDYVLDDAYHDWARLLDDDQVRSAIGSIQSVLNAHALSYKPPSGAVLTSLVQNLADRVPPVAASLNERGEPVMAKVDLAQVLYAGWVYWLGRSHFRGKPLDFLETNKFCHLALIQNDAIRKTIEEPAVGA